MSTAVTVTDQRQTGHRRDAFRCSARISTSSRSIAAFVAPRTATVPATESTKDNAISPFITFSSGSGPYHSKGISRNALKNLSHLADLDHAHRPERRPSRWPNSVLKHLVVDQVKKIESSVRTIPDNSSDEVRQLNDWLALALEHGDLPDPTQGKPS